MRSKSKAASKEGFKDIKMEKTSEINDEEDLVKSRKYEIIKTKMKLLKKCRQCNFKRRKCQLEQMKCNAALRNCWACGKVGHYPQSLNCKAKKRKQNKKQLNAAEKVNFHQNMKISEKSLKLVKKRIKQLEQESSVKLNQIANTRKAFSKPLEMRLYLSS